MICGLYFLAKKPFAQGFVKARIVLIYFLLAPVLAVLVWWPFWRDPLSKLLELPKFYSLNTFNMPVLFLGNIYRSGVNIPSFYPYVYLAVSTPLPILVPLVIGLTISLINAIRKKNGYLMVILWFFVPLLRYFYPRSGAIDGVRHFMEVLPPLSVFAGISISFLLNKLKRRYSYMVLIIIFTSLILNLIKYHPYQTSFFNSTIGGIRGASGKFDIDFWGTPQKEAVIWLNENASLNSYVHIVMAQSTAAVYLRNDLLLNLNKKNAYESDFLVLLNRQSFFDIYGISPKELLKKFKLVYTENLMEVPLVWVFKR